MQRENKANLSQNYAQFRAGHVSNVEYALKFDLTQKSHFSGEIDIAFEWKKHEGFLTVDFHQGDIDSLLVNEVKTELIYNDNYVSIPVAALREGENSIKIAFKHDYSKDGTGLYRFEDAQDKTSYLYSNFEPYDANKMFPCFDQPDLKATYSMEVLAPKSWQVISAARESSVSMTASEDKLWVFPKTKAFSTYIFSLHAGDYTFWSANGSDIPLRIYARKSMADYVEKDFWFEITKQGFAFFERYFDYDYPFGKYDQVIVPDFNSGAMENTGAITFSERYLTKGQYTRADRLGIAEVILHEMAHMWFGNLVTMRWWNDLWLNESFATYVSYLAMAENTEFKEAWHNFYESIKVWAYREDQRVITHSIEANIETTDDAFANFDGITYGKGASSLKQLHYLIGDEAFKTGMQNYFKSFAYKNTELPDFIQSLEKSAGKSLSSWVTDWLQSKGLNTLSANYSCNHANTIEQFQLQQGVTSGDDMLREHKANVVLYSVSDNKLTEIDNVHVSYKKESTDVSDLKGKVCPDFVFINEQDHDFVKVSFDQASVSFLEKNMHLFKDAYHRSMIWKSLWDMVRDQKLKISSYLNLVDQNLNKETDVNVFSQIAATLYDSRPGAHSILFYMLGPSGELAANELNYFEQWQETAWKVMSSGSASADFQQAWFTLFMQSAVSLKQSDKMLDLLEEKVLIPNLQLDQDKRWAIIRKLSELGYTQSEAWIQKELKKDVSSEGEKQSMAAMVSFPNLDDKKVWFEKLKNNKIDSLAKQKTLLRYLLPNNQMSMRQDLIEDYYTYLLKNQNQSEAQLADALSYYITPIEVNNTSLGKVESFIKTNKEKLLPAVEKNLLIMHQNYQEALQVKQFNR